MAFCLDSRVAAFKTVSQYPLMVSSSRNLRRASITPAWVKSIFTSCNTIPKEVERPKVALLPKALAMVVASAGLKTGSPSCCPGGAQTCQKGLDGDGRGPWFCHDTGHSQHSLFRGVHASRGDCQTGRQEVPGSRRR